MKLGYGTLVLVLLSKLNAQTLPDTAAQTLEEIVISAGRIAARYPEAARSISIIDSKQLQELPVRSVNEALEYIAGVDVRPRGPAGVQADISIRGESFENVLVLVDGVRMNDPQTGHHNLNIPVPMEEIERIEILRGPAARVFGQNAFSGVVNFITRKHAKAGLSARAVVGDFGYTSNQLTVSAPIRQYQQSVSLGRSASKGHRHNSDFGISDFYYRAGAGWGKNSLDITAGYSEREFGANAFYAEAFPDQWEAVNTGFIRVSGEHKGAWAIRPNIFWRRNTDEFLLRRHQPSFYRNHHVSDVTGADVNAVRQWRWGTTSIGAELRTEQLVSTNLGNRQRQNAGVYAEHRFVFWKRLHISPGFFSSWYSGYAPGFFPGVDLAYMPRPDLALYAAANKAFRVPSYTELYYQDPANLANPELRPEEAVSLEAGLRLTKRYLDLTASVFQKQGINVIDWVRASPADRWQVLNYNQLVTSGAELMLSVQPLRWRSGAIVEQVVLQYAFINSARKLEDLQSKYALDYMRQQAVLRIVHKLPLRLKMSWVSRYEERVGYTPYYLVDARLMRGWRNFTFFVETSNLLDQQYFEVSKVTMPGRWVSGGFSLKMD